MKLIPRALVLSLSLTILSNCGSPPASSNQAGSNRSTNRNTNAPASNSSPANANIQTNQSSTGAIEVTSAPPGARVLLISNDESGAGGPDSNDDYGRTAGQVHCPPGTVRLQVFPEGNHRQCGFYRKSQRGSEKAIA